MLEHVKGSEYHHLTFSILSGFSVAYNIGLFRTIDDCHELLQSINLELHVSIFVNACWSALDWCLFVFVLLSLHFDSLNVLFFYVSFCLHWIHKTVVTNVRFICTWKERDENYVDVTFIEFNDMSQCIVIIGFLSWLRLTGKLSITFHF